MASEIISLIQAKCGSDLAHYTWNAGVLVIASRYGRRTVYFKRPGVTLLHFPMILIEAACTPLIQEMFKGMLRNEQVAVVSILCYRSLINQL
jgi:hypothetical protein